ncbi:class I SAM-dependent methyltransferase [Candidatus Dependentiae bacterium]|nr:class I SAM-dependent methyltransferase [Candidatus Dependentiae bacterium]
MVNKKIKDNHNIYIERMNLFKNYGLDFIKERKKIISISKPIEGNILEIGTGKGYFTIELAKQGFNFTAIDSSTEELEYAYMNLQYYNLEKNVELKAMDAEKMFFPDDSFDIIFSVGMLHHLENPFLFVDEVLRILKSSGKFIISDFSEKGFAIIQENHKKEGKIHSENSTKISDIAKYIDTKVLKVNYLKTDFQDTLIVNGKK